MITAPAEKKLFLLDAFALIFRAYYAFIKNPRMNSKGVNTSAVFGFTNALLDIIRNEQPTHIAVVFDSPGDTFRTEQYPAYKANRDETPEDIIRSIPFIHQVLEGLQVPAIQLQGYEADDLIGYIAKKAAEDGYMVYMMTPDKDFGQLVTEDVKMFRPGRGGNPPEVWGPAEVCAQFGVDSPLQIIDLLGLMGDAADNIPGIPGVGAKTASKFIKQYGSLEGLLEHSGELKGKMREKVEANVEMAHLSKQLATICLDIPLEIDLDAFAVRPAEEERITEIFDVLEFKAMLRKVLAGTAKVAVGAEAVAATPSKTVAPEPTGQTDLFAVAHDAVTTAAEQPTTAMRASPNLSDVPHDYRYVNDDAGLDALIAALSAAPRFAFDTETTGLDTFSDRLVGLSFSTEKANGWWVPVTTDSWDAPVLLARLQPIFSDPLKEAVAHNLKFDMKVLLQHGLVIKNRPIDTMLAHYLLYPDARNGMNWVAEHRLGYHAIPLEDLIGKKGKDQRHLGDVDPADITDYACEDADITLQLAALLIPELEAADLSSLFHEVEMPLVAVLADMERSGVRLDGARLKVYSEELAKQLADLTAQIQTLAGRTFNLDSPKQLGTILFDELAIPARVRKTKTGQYHTGEEVLGKLTEKHEIIPLILQYRKLKKLRSTYVEPLPQLVHPDTGRIHTHYMQAVAATGRLSSKDPNLQNIPIRTAEGRPIREAFIPGSADHVLLAADYSQVELRIAAALSGDPGLCDAFLKGLDIHTATAARVFSVPLEEVDRDMRSKAKAVNFGILYGQGAFGLAANLGIKRGEAKEIIDAYFEQFASLKAFTVQCVDSAREHGYATTILGRKRPLPDIDSASANVRAFAERNAVNARIQGSAADVIKVAMIRIHAAMREAGLRSEMIMQVHDELVFDVLKSEVHDLTELVRKHMEEAVELAVPLVVDLSTGQDWLEAH